MDGPVVQFGRDQDGWMGVAQSAIRTHAPETADRIEFDPEADMFAANSSDPEALRRLGLLLRRALTEPDFLDELLRTADPDWFD